jgi:hypothetical protein
VGLADFFVSYTSSDKEWAHWIALELEKHGHVAHVHEWEVSGGDDIYAWMEKRHETADHVVCIFSDEYCTRHSQRWSAMRRSGEWQRASQGSC